MNLTLTFVIDRSPTAPVWREVHPGLWVARIQGDIVGSVEMVLSYIATDARGDVLGPFSTLVDAQAAIDGLTTVLAGTPRRVSRRVLAEWALILALPSTGAVLIAVIVGLVVNR